MSDGAVFLCPLLRSSSTPSRWTRDSHLIGAVFLCPLLRSSSTPSRWTRGLMSDWRCLLVSSPQIVVHPFTVDQGLASDWRGLLVSSPQIVVHPFTVDQGTCVRLALSSRVLSSGHHPPLHGGPGTCTEWQSSGTEDDHCVAGHWTYDSKLCHRLPSPMTLHDASYTFG